MSGRALIDRTTVVTANASLLVVPANKHRMYLLIQSPTASDFWIDFGIDAVKSAPSIKILGNGAPFIMSGPFVCWKPVYAIKNGTGSAELVIKEGIWTFGE